MFGLENDQDVFGWENYLHAFGLEHDQDVFGLENDLWMCLAWKMIWLWFGLENE